MGQYQFLAYIRQAVHNFITAILRGLVLSLYRKCEVGQFEGIRLAELKKTTQFREILLASLRLLQESDRRRYRRVCNHLSWIVHRTLAFRGQAEYNSLTGACEIDFVSPSPEYPPEYLIGWYACTLVHEATHGVLHSRGIPYTPTLRARVEHLCVKEEQRFLLHLTITRPDLAERLHREFGASDWTESWRLSATGRLCKELWRIHFPKE